MATSPMRASHLRAEGGDVFEQLDQAKGLLTAREVATLLAISPKTIYAFATRNKIPHYKIEASVRFRPRDIAEWLRQREVDGITP
ncbi:MAG: helix-turn-helix domain-containing protein [Bryobacteraceae bacterium]